MSQSQTVHRTLTRIAAYRLAAKCREISRGATWEVENLPADHKERERGVGDWAVTASLSHGAVNLLSSSRLMAAVNTALLYCLADDLRKHDPENPLLVGIRHLTEDFSPVLHYIQG